MQLTVTGSHARLTLQNDCLTIHCQQQMQSLPLNALERVTVNASCLLGADVIAALLDRKCEIQVERQQAPPTLLLSTRFMSNGPLRARWASYLSRRDIALWLCRRLLQAKCRSQRRNLRLMASITASGVAQRLHPASTIAVPALLASQNRSALMGSEGKCTADYFSALSALTPAWCKFTTRNKRPPTDPFNALLSLTYTLAAQRLTHLLVAAGFDPTSGILHLPTEYRASLTCDWIELFRAPLDLWLIRQVLPQLNHDHFDYDRTTGACLLNRSGKALYYKTWHTLRPRLEKRMNRLVVTMKQRILEDEKSPLSDNL